MSTPLIEKLTALAPYKWRTVKALGSLPAEFPPNPKSAAFCRGTIAAEYDGPSYTVSVRGERNKQVASDRRLVVALQRATAGAKGQEPRRMRIPGSGEKGSALQANIVQTLRARGKMSAREIAKALEVPETMLIAGIYRTLRLMTERGIIRVVGYVKRQGTPSKLYEAAC